MPDAPLLSPAAVGETAVAGGSVGSEAEAPAVNPESVFSYETDQVIVSL